jgi:hypothetical protein
MNPRHVAALALVGWYLMTSPWNRFPYNKLYGPKNDTAPMSQWKIIGSYDTAAKCEEDLQWYSELKKVFPDLICIASDDPRLAK